MTAPTSPRSSAGCPLRGLRRPPGCCKAGRSGRCPFRPSPTAQYSSLSPTLQTRDGWLRRSATAVIATSSMSDTTTAAAPSLTNRVARPSPIPWALPVTTTVLPCSRTLPSVFYSAYRLMAAGSFRVRMNKFVVPTVTDVSVAVISVCLPGAARPIAVGLPLGSRRSCRRH